jgi:dTDP-4-dehydrorhamnose reductase
MWARATGGLSTRVVSDQFGSPTFTGDLARATWTLIANDARGLYHVANRGTASWFDVASRVFEAAGRTPLLSPCRTEDYPTPASRPKFSVLDTTRVAREHGIVLPPWEASLNHFLSALAAPV